jgi:DNA modification methylase
MTEQLDNLRLVQPSATESERMYGGYELVYGDAFKWLDQAAANSIQCVVTDPPYGLIEYDPEQLTKKRNGRGGVWRIPPTLDGYTRSPVPRFTVLKSRDRTRLESFFARLAERLYRVLVPGAHVFVATNPLVSHHVYGPLMGQGFEKRGELIRLVATLRGGDRPKNAHDEFPGVTVMPRSGWEPWGVFRKPLEGRVQDNLRKWRTGGLRRISSDEPFKDVIPSFVAPQCERDMAPHPSLKPQALLRQLVRAGLPLGEGVILDPFMGSGSTIAAASACGLKSVGIEHMREYFEVAVSAVPRLRSLEV